MDQNLTIYQIALRYVIMAFLVGIGAGITSFDGFLNILGFVMMALGMATFLVCVLGIDPFVGKNKDAKEASKQDFIEQ
jgi:hypothetical protein